LTFGHPGLGGLQLLDVAAVVCEHRARRLHVAAPGQLQLEVDAVGFALLLQRGNLRTKAVCRLSVFGGFGDLRLELRDPGIPLSQLRLVCCRVSAASCCSVICRISRLRFLLVRLLLRRLLLLLLRVLLRLRAILLTVHDRRPFIQAGRMKNARTVTDAGIVFVRHKVTLDAAFPF